MYCVCFARLVVLSFYESYFIVFTIIIIIIIMLIISTAMPNIKFIISNKVISDIIMLIAVDILAGT